MNDATPTGGPLTASVKRGVAWSTLTFALSKGLSLLSVLVLARLLAPRQFGIVAAIMVVLSFIELSSDLGMKATVIYEQGQGSDERMETAFTLNMGLAAALTVLGILIAPLAARFFHVPGHTWLFRLAFLDVLLTALGSVHDGILLRDMRFNTRITTEVLGSAVRAVLGVTLALIGFGASSLVVGMLAGTAAWTVALWFFTGFHPRLHFDRSAAQSMLGYGVGASSLSILSQIYTQVDPVTVGRVLGQRALGLYTVAFRLPILALENVSYQISLVAFPALARKRVIDAEGVGGATQRLVRYQALYALPLAVGMAVMAEPIIRVFFSVRWLPATGVFAAVSLLSGASAATFALGDGFKALGRQRVMVALSAVQIPLVVATIILVAPLGITAVAWARTAGELFWSAAMIIAASRVLGVPVRRTMHSLWPGVAAAIGVLIATGAVRLWSGLPALPELLVAAVAGGTAAVCTLALLSRATFREVAQLASGVRRAPPWMLQRSRV